MVEGSYKVFEILRHTSKSSINVESQKVKKKKKQVKKFKLYIENALTSPTFVCPSVQILKVEVFEIKGFYKHYFLLRRLKKY